MAKNLLDLVGLLNFDGNSDGVDGRLDQASLVLTSRDNNLVQDQLLTASDFNLGLIVTLHILGREVSQAGGRGERCLHSIKIRFQGACLKSSKNMRRLALRTIKYQ